MRNLIQHTIKRFGFFRTYTGYKYLVYALELTVHNEDYLLAVTKQLYPEIAKSFNSSPQCVERNLRTLVNAIWHKGNRQTFTEIAGYEFSQQPTTTEFIDIITSYLADAS